MNYPWPASSIDKNDMAVLYRMKQLKRTPITELIAQAVRQVYGESAEMASHTPQLKEAA